MQPPHIRKTTHKHITHSGYTSADISETLIHREEPDILDILLTCRSRSRHYRRRHNIIWGNDNYAHLHPEHYAPTAEIRPELITGDYDKLIMPRALKSSQLQKERTKSKAEVFTPLHIVRQQNDTLDEAYSQDDTDTYVRRTWMEITCGEAPYMASRYDMLTGELIDIACRTGFVDRKLKRINRDATCRTQWMLLATRAYQASYAFEWNGDSLLLARENLLYTCRDYYVAKWAEEIPPRFLRKIARIISYNVFQMDGIQRSLPLSPKVSDTHTHGLFTASQMGVPARLRPHRIQVMNWQTGRLENFE